jgi:hypothetical protein
MTTQDQLTAPSRLLPGLVVSVVGGLLTGGFVAWAYYDDAFRPLAHAFGLWITLVVLLSARRPVGDAVARSVLGLATAVLAFYVGLKVMYGIDYPGAPYSLNRDQITEWLVLAVIAGCLFGWVFCRVGWHGRAGTVATAAAVGLLVGDAYRRGSSYRGDIPVITTMTVIGIALVLAVAVRSRRQLARVALWTLPMAALGLLLASAPDAFEQLLTTGSL